MRGEPSSIGVELTPDSLKKPRPVQAPSTMRARIDIAFRRSKDVHF